MKNKKVSLAQKRPRMVKKWPNKGINLSTYPGWIRQLEIELFSPRITISVIKVKNIKTFMEGFITCFPEGTYHLPDNRTSGITLRDIEANGPIIYVILSQHPTERTIAHESYHVAHTIAKIYDITDEEWVAYFVGNLTEAIINWRLPA